MDDILGPEGQAGAGEGQQGRDADGPGAGYTSTGVLVYRVQDGPMSAAWSAAAKTSTEQVSQEGQGHGAWPCTLDAAL